MSPEEVAAANREVEKYRESLWEMLRGLLREVNSRELPLENFPKEVAVWQDAARRLELQAWKAGPEELTRLLCAACRWWGGVTSNALLAPETLEWWLRHKSADDERMAQEASVSTDDGLIASERSKLTADEMEALQRAFSR